MDAIAKNNLSQALGAVFLNFLALETGWTIDGFLFVQRILSRAGAVVNNIQFSILGL